MKDIRKIKAEDVSPLLLEMPNPPKELYIRGENPDTSRIFITIVGARRNTSYGAMVCEKIISGLAGYDITIVSGLAIGIDAIAHRCALKYNLPTIAILGSGLDDSVLYPRTNYNLAHKILESGGTLLSELEAKEKAARYTFLSRNRLMASASTLTIVAECARYSGTMVTAKLATEYNREVSAIPGSIFSSVSEGPNYLIAEGAHAVTSAEDVLNLLNIELKENTFFTPQDLTAEEKEVLDLITEPISKESLTANVKLPVHLIQSTLTLLEIKKLVKEVDGKLYRI